MLLFEYRVNMNLRRIYQSYREADRKKQRRTPSGVSGSKVHSSIIHRTGLSRLGGKDHIYHISSKHIDTHWLLLRVREEYTVMQCAYQWKVKRYCCQNGDTDVHQDPMSLGSFYDMRRILGTQTLQQWCVPTTRDRHLVPRCDGVLSSCHCHVVF